MTLVSQQGFGRGGPQEKDVTLVIGNKIFQHSSYMLRLSSPFFDAMFSHDFRERNEMLVRFPDKDPRTGNCYVSFSNLV